MVLGLTQRLPEMSTKSTSWADNLVKLMCCLSRNPGSLKVPEPLDPVQDCIGFVLP